MTSPQDLEAAADELLQSFDDLEALVTESLALSAARKAKAQGRRLSDEDTARLSEAAALAEASKWAILTTLRLHLEERCSCGSRVETLGGYYSIKKHVKLSDTRIEHLPAGVVPSDFALFQKTVWVNECPQCAAPASRVVTVADFPILKAL